MSSCMTVRGYPVTRHRPLRTPVEYGPFNLQSLWPRGGRAAEPYLAAVPHEVVTLRSDEDLPHLPPVTYRTFGSNGGPPSATSARHVSW